MRSGWHHFNNSGFLSFCQQEFFDGLCTVIIAIIVFGSSGLERFSELF
jgi:hypothetical protein